MGAGWGKASVENTELREVVERFWCNLGTMDRLCASTRIKLQTWGKVALAPLHFDGDALYVVLGILLRQGGDDCRAGNHGHKSESNQNFVHRRLL